MKRQTDHSFNYRNLDNVDIYKDGMTHQQYYLYNFGYNWQKEREWSINDDVYMPKDFNGEVVIRTAKEPVELFYDFNDIKNQSFDLKYDKVKHGILCLNIESRTLDRIRFKHPIPDKFMSSVEMGLIFCQKEELENPLTSLLREGLLEYHKFEMTLPIKLYYQDWQDLYIVRGWRKIDEIKRKD